MLNLAKNLEREARSAAVLVIWTDCDQEGESIGAEVASICKKSNPNIRVKRAKFSSIQQRCVVSRIFSASLTLFHVDFREIENAWRNLIELDQRQVEAVAVRQELDLRIGAAFTRLQTLYLQKIFPDIGTISYGKST